jgi:hypothetical protein
MNERDTNAAIKFLAAGAAAGLTLTYIARASRARMRKPVTQAMTIAVSRQRIERFVEDRDSMLRALQSKKRFSNIERLELRDAPGERGTEVHLSMRGLGKYAIKDVLRRMKALLECGEIPTGRRFA